MEKIEKKVFKCDDCNFESADKSNFNRHNKSRKHINRVKGLPNIKLNKCDKCDYETYHMSNFKKHVLTHEGKQKKKYIARIINNLSPFNTLL